MVFRLLLISQYHETDVWIGNKSPIIIIILVIILIHIFIIIILLQTEFISHTASVKKKYPTYFSLWGIFFSATISFAFYCQHICPLVFSLPK